MLCVRPGCTGTIVDGYCDVCGLPALAPPAAPPQTRAPAPPAIPAPPTGRGVAGIVPTLKPTGKCRMPGCPGNIVDGYCDTCGAPAGTTASAPAPGRPTTASRLTTTAMGSALGGQRTRATIKAQTSTSRLGAGYTTVPPEPPVDPISAILKNPEVPEDKRFCPHCGAEVGRSTADGPGRVEGYCPKCRKPYSFTPKLAPGDLVAGQYEVSGCLAHGGMGWIYLAQDKNVSDRWVVLKGLLNAGDEASMQAAMTEQRFLAQIDNPLIVEIFNFVTHDSGAYIVMEFVGGRSLKQILKDRMAANNGIYDPLPPDQACAFILEVLPAFSYLHARGLLYCDFKPDNLMHVADTVKLIDMGGVRRIDDDESVIFGTVGFQAPEVPTLGCTVASDIYTIGRTLMLLVAETKGYQTTYATTLPPVDSMPAFLHHDSLYRLVEKCCTPNPSDRFSSVEELRVQLLGVLREIVSASHVSATSSVPSALFDPPTVVSDAFTWKQLPTLRPDPLDPAATWLNDIDPSELASSRMQTLRGLPSQTLGVKLAEARVSIEMGSPGQLAPIINDILAADPWEWRAVWMQGLGALNAGDWPKAQASFNAVYGQVPGELAPKFALAVACEMGDQIDVAEELYKVCAATDTAYVTGSAFGLARIRVKRRDASGQIQDTGAVLQALDLIPATSGGWAQSRTLAATYLTHSGRGVSDLQRAYAAVSADPRPSPHQLRLELEIFSKAESLVHASPRTRRQGLMNESIGGVPLTKPALRKKIEAILRQWASLETDAPTRIALIDQANSMRGWTAL